MFGNKKKLSLNKETVRALSGNEMQGLVGGMILVHGGTCTCKCAPTLVCSVTCLPPKTAVFGF